TGAILALIDADDRHHRALRELFEDDPDAWVLPGAVLPEVDYLVAAHVGSRAETAFLAGLAGGLYRAEWGDEAGLARARDVAGRWAARPGPPRKRPHADRGRARVPARVPRGAALVRGRAAGGRRVPGPVPPHLSRSVLARALEGQAVLSADLAADDRLCARMSV